MLFVNFEHIVLSSNRLLSSFHACLKENKGIKFLKIALKQVKTSCLTIKCVGKIPTYQ